MADQCLFISYNVVSALTFTSPGDLGLLMCYYYNFWSVHNQTTSQHRSQRIHHDLLTLKHKLHEKNSWHYYTVSDVTLPVSRDLSRSRLRSADTTDFIVPRTRTKFGDRAFCVSGPTIWNSLPESLQSITCTATFKRHLKTHFLKHFLS